MNSQNMSDFKSEMEGEYIEVDEEYDDTKYVCGCMKVVKKIRKKRILIAKNVKKDNLYILQVYDERYLVNGRAAGYADLYISGNSLNDVLTKFESEAKLHSSEEIRQLPFYLKKRNYTLSTEVQTQTVGIGVARKYTL